MELLSLRIGMNRSASELMEGLGNIDIKSNVLSRKLDVSVTDYEMNVGYPLRPVVIILSEKLD